MIDDLREFRNSLREGRYSAKVNLQAAVPNCMRSAVKRAAKDAAVTESELVRWLVAKGLSDYGIKALVSQ